jgi:hypothetical protein
VSQRIHIKLVRNVERRAKKTGFYVELRIDVKARFNFDFDKKTTKIREVICRKMLKNGDFL